MTRHPNFHAQRTNPFAYKFQFHESPKMKLQLMKPMPSNEPTMPSPQRKPSTLILAFLVGLATSVLAHAAGVGVSKDQQFQSDAGARAFVFSSVKDDGGRFVVFNIGRKQIPVDRIHSPRYVTVWSRLPMKITTEAELEPVVRKHKELTDFANRFRRAKPLLQGHIDALSETIQTYKSGMVRVDGRWTTKKNYVAAQKKVQKEASDKALAQRKEAEDRKAREKEARNKRELAQKEEEERQEGKELAKQKMEQEQVETVEAGLGAKGVTVVAQKDSFGDSTGVWQLFYGSEEVMVALLFDSTFECGLTVIARFEIGPSWNSKDMASFKVKRDDGLKESFKCVGGEKVDRTGLTYMILSSEAERLIEFLWGSKAFKAVLVTGGGSTGVQTFKGDFSDGWAKLATHRKGWASLAAHGKTEDKKAIHRVRTGISLKEAPEQAEGAWCMRYRSEENNMGLTFASTTSYTFEITSLFRFGAEWRDGNGINFEVRKDTGEKAEFWGCTGEHFGPGRVSYMVFGEETVRFLKFVKDTKGFRLVLMPGDSYGKNVQGTFKGDFAANWAKLDKYRSQKDRERDIEQRMYMEKCRKEQEEAVKKQKED